ncbi:ATP-binding protein, partial [Streptomyces sp. NPDC059949]|uniref:ATP-binding protein n=1 Tax=Streptomyces sp. NPDC059949 TaxID=3347013 RepID=UPI00365C3DDF
MAKALAHAPAVVLVEGEAGSGKSRLVREALKATSTSPLHTLVAVCPPYREPSTLGPIVDAARHAVPDGIKVGTLGLSALAGTLRPLFPEWADGLPPAPEPLTDTGAARHRLIRAFGELLHCLGIDVLVVEDVHWADEATLEFLLFLVSRQPPFFTLVLTYRPEEVTADSVLLRLSSRVPAGAGIGYARVRLGPLAVAHTAQLMSSMLDGQHVSADFAAFLHDRTEGVPLATEECVRLLLDREDLVRRNGQWTRRSLDEIAVPPTIRDAVTERLARLHPDTRRLLLAAAVLADPADETALAHLAGLTAGRAVEAAVREAVRSGLLVDDGTGTGRLAFRHTLAARTVYEQAPPSERRAAHRRAAALLEQARPGAAPRLVHHLRHAGRPARWCRSAEQAADIALASGDHLTAVTLLHELITHPHLPAQALGPLVRKMPFLAFTGHPRRKDILHALRQVLERENLSARDRADVRGQLGRILFSLGEHAAAATELEAAIPDLEPGRFADAWTMTVLGFPWTGTWPATAHLHWLDRARHYVRGSALAPHEQLTLHVNHMTALLELGEESGWELAAAPCPHETTPQIALERARADLNSGDAAIRWGRYAVARTRLTRAVDAAERHAYPVVRDTALVTLLRLDYLTGAWQGLAERAQDWATTADDPMCRTEAQLVGAQLKLATTGADQETEDLLQALAAEGERRGVMALWLEAAATLARLRLAAGDCAHALDLTDGPVRLITRKDIWIWASDIAPARTAALTAAGRLAEAARLTADFEAGLHERGAPAARAALTECLAVLTEARGEHGAAQQAWDRAAAAWSQLPRPGDAARART